MHARKIHIILKQLPAFFPSTLKSKVRQFWYTAEDFHLFVWYKKPNKNAQNNIRSISIRMIPQQVESVNKWHTGQKILWLCCNELLPKHFLLSTFETAVSNEVKQKRRKFGPNVFSAEKALGGILHIKADLQNLWHSLPDMQYIVNPSENWADCPWLILLSYHRAILHLLYGTCHGYHNNHETFKGKQHFLRGSIWTAALFTKLTQSQRWAFSIEISHLIWEATGCISKKAYQHINESIS